MRVVPFLMLLCFAAPTFAEPQSFFPPPASDEQAFLSNWFSEHLQALKEKPLCCGALGDPVVIRFTWLRTFHHPVAIRVFRSKDGKWNLQTKVSDGLGGYEPGKLSSDTTKVLAPSEADSVLSLVSSRSSYWTMSTTLALPTFDKPNEVVVGTDGSEWIIEVLDRPSYHYVVRHTPGEGLVHEVGLRLIALSGQDFGEIY